MDASPVRGLDGATLGDLVAALSETYGGTLGVEFLSIPDKAQRETVAARMKALESR